MLSRLFIRTKHTHTHTRKKQAEKDLKRKIAKIQKKRRFLTATIEDLIKDADKYKFDAA